MQNLSHPASINSNVRYCESGKAYQIRIDKRAEKSNNIITLIKQFIKERKKGSRLYVATSYDCTGEN